MCILRTNIDHCNSIEYDENCCQNYYECKIYTNCKCNCNKCNCVNCESCNCDENNKYSYCKILTTEKILDIVKNDNHFGYKKTITNGKVLKSKSNSRKLKLFSSDEDIKNLIYILRTDDKEKTFSFSEDCYFYSVEFSLVEFSDKEYHNKCISIKKSVNRYQNKEKQIKRYVKFIVRNDNEINESLYNDLSEDLSIITNSGLEYVHIIYYIKK